MLPWAYISEDEEGAVAEHQVEDGGDTLGHVLLEVLHVLLVLVENLAPLKEMRN